jgi:hypothetical protein
MRMVQEGREAGVPRVHKRGAQVVVVFFLCGRRGEREQGPHQLDPLGLRPGRMQVPDA